MLRRKHRLYGSVQEFYFRQSDQVGFLIETTDQTGIQKGGAKDRF